MAYYMGHEYTPQQQPGRFRVGDRVRVVKDGCVAGGSGHGAEAGEVTTIRECSGVSRYYYGADNGYYFFEEELEPSFLPGDRVKLRKHYGIRVCGERGMVTSVANGNCFVRMDELSYHGGRVGLFPADVLDWEREEDKKPVGGADDDSEHVSPISAILAALKSMQEPKWKKGDRAYVEVEVTGHQHNDAHISVVTIDTKRPQGFDVPAYALQEVE